MISVGLPLILAVSKHIHWAFQSTCVSYTGPSCPPQQTFVGQQTAKRRWYKHTGSFGYRRGKCVEGLCAYVFKSIQVAGGIWSSFGIGLVLAFGLEDYWMCPASCEVVPPWIGFAGPTHLIDAQLDWALGNLEASGFHLPNTCNLRTDLIYPQFDRCHILSY